MEGVAWAVLTDCYVYVCGDLACRGASWTAARNAPGSFALFGGSAFVKDYVFALEK